MADKVTIELELLAKRAQDSLENFISRAQKGLSGISLGVAITAINQGFELMERTAGRAFSAVKGFAEDSINEAVLAEEAQTNLNNALRLSGDFTEEAAKQFDRFAKSLQQTTKFSDEQVLNSLALTKQFGLSNAEAERAVRAAADLAAALGEDLNSATFKVGQTFNGFLSRDLVKIAPELRNMSKEALINGEALAIIERRVRGSAAALGDTFSGALTQAKNAFSDFQETIGGFVTNNPQVIAILKEVRKAFEELNASLQANGDSIRQLVSGGLILFIQAVPLLAKGLQNITKNFTAAIFYVEKFGAVLGAIGAAVSSFLSGDRTGQGGEIFRALSEDLDALDEKFGKTLNDQEALFDPIIKSATDLAGRVSNVKGEVKSFGDQAQKSLSGQGARFDAIFGPEQIQQFTRRINELRDSLDTEVKGKLTEISNKPLSGVIELAIKGQEELDKAKNKIDQTVSEIANNKDIPEAFRKQARELGAKAKEGLEEAFSSKNVGLQLATNLIGSIRKGAAGAAEAVAEVAGGVATALFGPIIGNLVKQAISFLAQGPAAVKEQIQSFIRALPEVFKNILLAIPEVFQTFIEEIPNFVSKIFEALPSLVERLIGAFPRLIAAWIREIPKVVVALVQGIVRGVPEIVKGFVNGLLSAGKDFVQAIIDAFKDLFGGLFNGKGLFGGGGEGGGGLLSGSGIPIISDIGNFLGLADGGRIPDLPQYNNDRFPARLSAGEQVLSKDLSSKLDSFLSGAGGGGPQVVQITIGQRELARVLLDLNRNGFRTA